MSKLKYHGSTWLCDNCKGEPFYLETDKEYEAYVQMDGPQMIVNGVPIENEDTTYWVVLNEGRTALPYSKVCLERHWEVVEP